MLERLLAAAIRMMVWIWMLTGPWDTGGDL
jgi:hypothetical protein